MKIFLITSLSVLVIGCFFAWMEHGRIRELRNEHRELTKAAADLGIHLDNGNLILSKKSSHASGGHVIGQAEVAAFILDYNKLTDRIDEHERSGTQPEKNLRRQEFEFIKRMANLQPELAEAILNELKETSDISVERAQQFAAKLLFLFGAKEPEMALSLSFDHRDFFGERFSKDLIANILDRFARNDPEGALSWLQETLQTTPAAISPRGQSEVLAGVGRKEPARAFALAEELFPDASGPVLPVLEDIVWAAVDGAGRTQLLDAIRSYGMRAGQEEPGVKSELISELGSSIVFAEISPSDAWMETANLTDEEIDAFAKGVAKTASKNSRAASAWGTWLGENLSPGPDGQQTIKRFVSKWADDDYQAAGEWILNTKDGPIKDAAVEGYARAIAQYEPDSAEEWARTLPDGAEREALLDDIQRHRIEGAADAPEEE